MSLGWWVVFPRLVCCAACLVLCILIFLAVDILYMYMPTL
jgi:hypothetical protein